MENQNTNKVRFWNQHKSWNEAERTWDKRSDALKVSVPLKGIKHPRQLPGIRAATRKHLRWKALKYLLQHDKNKVMRFFWRKPWQHFRNMLGSYRQRQSYIRDGDFFLYGFPNTKAFRKRVCSQDTFTIFGFSYCHKPFECPSGRFTDECIHDSNNRVCGQCFIGKCVHAIPEQRSRAVFIPTVHYIAEKVVETIDAHPNYEIVFVITACELTLEMFGDWGNSIGIRGVGVRLDGQICNTMKAFEASEIGIKPGLAVVLPPTQKRILELIEMRRNSEVRE